MRAVIDTNVLVSGLIWRGTPHRLIDHLRTNRLTLVSSPTLIAELVDVFARAKFKAIFARTGVDPDRIVADVWRLAEILDPPPLETPLAEISMMTRCWR